MHNAVTIRQVNQETSAIMRSVREDSEIVPLTFGRDTTPFAYIVPATTLHDADSVPALLSAVTVNTKSGRSLRERFHPVPLGYDAAHSLQQMREEEPW